MIDYSLQKDLHIEQVYKNFINCLKGSDRDTWIAILRENPGKKISTSWKNHLHQYIKETLPKEPVRKQIKYLKNAGKPRKLTVRKWIRKIKNINSLLPMMGGEKIDEEKLIKDVIALNLPDSWIKPFNLSGTHQYDTTKKVMSTLEILKNDEQAYSHKLRSRNKIKLLQIRVKRKNKRTCVDIIGILMQNSNGRIAFINLKVKITADILERKTKKSRRKSSNKS